MNEAEKLSFFLVHSHLERCLEGQTILRRFDKGKEKDCEVNRDDLKILGKLKATRTHLIPFDEFFSLLKCLGDFDKTGTHSNCRKRWSVPRALLIWLRNVVRKTGCKCSSSCCCQCCCCHILRCFRAFFTALIFSSFFFHKIFLHKKQLKTATHLQQARVAH